MKRRLILAGVAVALATPAIAEEGAAPTISNESVDCQAGGTCVDPQAADPQAIVDADTDQEVVGGQRPMKLWADQPAQNSASSVTGKKPHYALVTAAAPARPSHRPGSSVSLARAASAPPSFHDLGVSFANGSSALTPVAKANLQLFVKAMGGANAGRNYEIAGHTNAVGARDYNLELSQQRAQAVVDYLVANGIASSRLTAKGYGFDRPRAGIGAVDPRNRRVNINLVN